MFVSGTDTGVGKTLVTALLLLHLRRTGLEAVALKPFCAGSAADVNLLQGLQPGLLSDTEVNPYYYDEPVAPLVAARHQNQRVSLSQVLKHLGQVRSRAQVVLVEGAGGLLTPLGEGFSLLDIVVGCANSRVLVVARNRLGAINHTLLTVERLRLAGVNAVEVVLSGDRTEDASASTNQVMIQEIIHPIRVQFIPFLGPNASNLTRLRKRHGQVRKTLARLAGFAMNSPAG